ncbi:MAG TPA: flagellar protein FlaG [Chromatiales bacterium]|nr:flagellar protein FlaG [Chromatiales bacterium]
MSIDLNSRVTTDVVYASSQAKLTATPPETEAPSVKLVGSGRQPDQTSGNQTLPAVVNEDPSAATEASKISEAVSRMSDYVQNIRRGLEFSVDEESDRTVITVYDIESEEVIRQIPSEEFLNLVRQMKGENGGALINEKV